jgi:hypothetical protein
MDREINGDFGTYKKYVVEELRRLARENVTLRDEVVKLRVQVTVLTVRSGVWGAAAGLLTAITVYLLAGAKG